MRKWWDRFLRRYLTGVQVMMSRSCKGKRANGMGLDFEKFAGTGFREKQKMGAEQAELYVVRKVDSVEVELKDGRIDEIKQSDSVDGLSARG